MGKLLAQTQWQSVFVVLVAEVVVLLTQLPLAGQEAHPFDGQIVLAQAMQPDHQAQGKAQQGERSFGLYGGSYQLVDNTGGACVGQCAVPNPFTNDCTCLESAGFIGIEAVRIMIDATCGSFLVTCLK